jgi:hypothetical protein
MELHVQNAYKNILLRYPHNDEIKMFIQEHSERIKYSGEKYIETVLLESAEYKNLIKGRYIWKVFKENYFEKISKLNIKNIPYESEYTVVMVEPRKHEDMKYVLRNVMHMCDGNWALHIFHGNKNETYIKEIVKNWGRIHFHNLKVDNLLPLPIGNSLDNLYKSVDFWNRLKKHKYALCIQCDTLMIDKNIEPFLKFDYDYIGAPWNRPVVGSDKEIKVGCGGFSLRKVKSMIKVIKNNKREDNTPEDVFFSKYCENVATYEVAKYFCVEHIFNEYALGIHRPWLYGKNQILLNKLGDYITDEIK